MRLSSVTTHGKIAIGRPGHMSTTGSPAIGVLVRDPPIKKFCILNQEDRRHEPAAINLLYVRWSLCGGRT
jgi:hypothetical protein